MPIKQELRVEAKVHYQTGLRKGDQVTLPRGITGLIESMSAKEKYLHVTLVGGTTGRFPLGSEVNVIREVATDDEQIAADLEKITERVANEWTHVKKRLEADVDKLHKEFTSRIKTNRLDVFDFKDAAQIKLTEFTYRLWAEVMAHLVDVADMETTRRGAAALRAVMRVRHQTEKDLTRRTQRSLSRSTSVISNLEDDMKREAQTNFLDDTHWWGVEDVWERIAGVL